MKFAVSLIDSVGRRGELRRGNLREANLRGQPKAGISCPSPWIVVASPSCPSSQCIFDLVSIFLFPFSFFYSPRLPCFAVKHDACANKAQVRASSRRACGETPSMFVYVRRRRVASSGSSSGSSWGVKSPLVQVTCRRASLVRLCRLDSTLSSIVTTGLLPPRAGY